MPFPAPFLAAILIAACLAGGAMGIIRLASSRSFSVHTHFTLAQVTEIINNRPQAEIATTAADLITILQSASIDWNSCRINSSGLNDSWGEPIRMTFDGKNTQWKFLSAGKDRKFDTPDDIEAHTHSSSESGPRE